MGNMKFGSIELLCSLIAIASLASYSTGDSHPLRSKDFPKGFIFGAGSASYQYEGAWNEDGKGPSIWDVFTHKYPEKIADRSNGDVANDFYHRFKEDVKIMKEIGLDSFRFSISWTRILPHGTLRGGVNGKGISFYNALINELIANGITPFVTLFHWDTPQALDAEYGSFLSPKIVHDYRDYVEVCFKAFGDRVKNWATFNEPNIFTLAGYTLGIHAPGRCSNYVGNCTAGNSATEPYIVGHNLLLSHAAAVELYKRKYQPVQKGIIGITVATNWYVPINGTSANIAAAARAKDFMFGWFIEPVTLGRYPRTMRRIVGSRLPKFTPKQSQLLKGSLDFLGFNYYASFYATADFSPVSSNRLSYLSDYHVTSTNTKNGVPIGELTNISTVNFYPKGLYDLVPYLKENYNNPPLIVTENGYGDLKNSSSWTVEPINDVSRVKYISGHIAYLYKAIKPGGNVKGYFIWSFLDDFEWGSGYTQKYGIVKVDYANRLKRTLKQSAKWYKNFLAKSS